MKTLGRIIRGFFMVLGMIFFVILIFFAYVILADPFHLKPYFLSGQVQEPYFTNKGPQNENNVEGNPLLSDDQERTLRSLGIDPTSLPTEITPVMEDCFAKKLGGERTKQIVDGDPPTVFDFFKARSCLGT